MGRLGNGIRRMTRRCQSCRWWDRSNNFRAIGRDWGLCHLWGGKTGRRMLNGIGFIDYSFGHEPLGADTCEHHNADPAQKASIQISGKMPPLKLEGELQ
jgi:hypothetical protein